MISFFSFSINLFIHLKDFLGAFTLAFTCHDLFQFKKKNRDLQKKLFNENNQILLKKKNDLSCSKLIRYMKNYTKNLSGSQFTTFKMLPILFHTFVLICDLFTTNIEPK